MSPPTPQVAHDIKVATALHVAPARPTFMHQTTPQVAEGLHVDRGRSAG